jgi:hypothetical protein
VNACHPRRPSPHRCRRLRRRLRLRRPSQSIVDRSTAAASTARGASGPPLRARAASPHAATRTQSASMRPAMPIVPSTVPRGTAGGRASRPTMPWRTASAAWELRRRPLPRRRHQPSAAGTLRATTRAERRRLASVALLGCQPPDQTNVTTAPTTG